MHDAINLMLFAAILALLVGAGLRQLLERWRLPYTVALLLIGLALGGAERVNWFAETPQLAQLIHYLSYLPPHQILLLFLPVLVFQSALSLEPHLFRRLLPTISVLAVGGVLIATLLTAALVKLWIPWEWSIALLFGALISATDPVAVVALLHELGARKRLEVIIEGESLLNDGSAIVLFSLFSVLLLPGSEFSLAQTGTQFLLTVLGGFAVGLVLAWLVLIWMRALVDESMAQISLTLSAAYGSYVIAELVLHVSGVVALVTLGTVMAGRLKLVLKQPTVQFMQQFWQLLAHVANTLIFLIVGITIAVRTPVDVGASWWWLPLVFVVITLARALMLLSLWPLLRKLAGVNFDKLLVLGWGGLRGAIALVLALTLVETMEGSLVAQQILVLTTGIVVLTLVINGSSMARLLAWRKLDGPPPARRSVLSIIGQQLQARLHSELQQMQQQPLYRLANAERMAGLNPSASEFGEICQMPDQLTLTRQLLSFEKQQFVELYQQGAISRAAFQKLSELSERWLDDEPTLRQSQQVAEIGQLPWLLRVGLPAEWTRPLARLSTGKLIQRYEMARGFLLAQQRLADKLDQLVVEPSLAKTFATAVQANIEGIERRISAFEQSFHGLAAAVQQQAAVRMLAQVKEQWLAECVEEGVIEHGELPQFRQPLLASRVSPTQVQPCLLDRLHELPGLSSLSGRMLDQLIVAGQHQFYDQGELLSRQGKPAHLLILLAGQAEAFCVDAGSVTAVTLLGAGAVLLPDAEQPLSGYSVKSVTPVEVLELAVERYAQLVEQFPEQAQRLYALRYQPQHKR